MAHSTEELYRKSKDSKKGNGNDDPPNDLPAGIRLIIPPSSSLKAPPLPNSGDLGSLQASVSKFMEKNFIFLGFLELP
jgi:hypothetical protein